VLDIGYSIVLSRPDVLNIQYRIANIERWKREVVLRRSQSDLVWEFLVVLQPMCVGEAHATMLDRTSFRSQPGCSHYSLPYSVRISKWLRTAEKCAN